MHQSNILSFFGKSTSEAKEIAPKAAKIKKDVASNDDNDNVFEKSKKTQKRRTILNSDSECSEDDKKPNKSLKMDVATHEKKKTSSQEEIITNPLEYDPSKKPYNIVLDACWRANEKVPYLALARTFSVIESISARLEITRVLSNFLRSVIYLSKEDLIPSIYLCLNKVAPDYEGIELGIGDFVIIDALVQATDTSKDTLKSLMKEHGDLGTVAENLKSTQQYLCAPQKLSLRTVFSNLKEIAYMSGKNVQKNKVKIIKNMLTACKGCEKKYLIRGLSGKLRIGLAEQTVLAALGQALTLTPANSEDCSHSINNLESVKVEIDANTAILKNAFCECPNYNLIIDTIVSKSLAQLPLFCSITPGVPIKPMLAHPSKGVVEIFRRFDQSTFSCEYKYDGERAQIHVQTDAAGKVTVQVFSRNQENNTTKYPDIVRVVTAAVDASEGGVRSCILDTEAVAWDRISGSILPFQQLSTRKRKDVSEKDIKIQVCVYAFDMLYVNGESMVTKSFRERRDRLRSSFVEKDGQFVFATSLDSADTDEISQFLEASIRDKCEGLMVKTLDEDASYEISKRSRKWLKLKKDYLDNIGDSLDLVVIGASFGNGKRANMYGNFLLACYEPTSQTFQSICKLGTGLSESQLEEIHATLSDLAVERPPRECDIDPTCKMDVWFVPQFVWEVRAADLSLSPVYRAALGLADRERGVSLRFPRFLKAREDKKPEEATSARQVAEMYRGQAQLAAGPEPEDDDDY